MREKNIITPTLFLVLILFTTTFCTYSIATKFDWVLFAISISFCLIEICLNYNSFSISENSESVLKERFKLYQLLESKKDRLTEVTDKIMKSRNANVLIDLVICSLSDNGKIYNTDQIEEMILKGSLIEELIKNGATRKKIKRIKSLQKYYNRKDDIEEIIRQFQTKELINKKSVNLTASLLTVLGIIFSVFAFFKIDFQAVSLSTNLILIFVIFAINVFGIFESYGKIKKFQVNYYQRLQDIIENEKMDRY